VPRIKVLQLLEAFSFKKEDTVLHKLDPRSKIAFEIIVMVAVFFLSLTTSIALLFFILLLHYKAKTLDKVKRSLYGSLPLLALIFLLNFLFSAKASLLERAAYSATMALRLVILLLAMGVLFLTTSPEELSAALVKMGISYDIALALILTIRFIPTLAREAETIVDAQLSRGLELEKGSFLKRLRNMLPILIPLIVLSIEKTDAVAASMESRCFGAVKKRTFYKEPTLKKADIAFVGAVILVVAALCIISALGLTPL